MPQRKEELAEWGELALRQLRGPVATSVRQKIANWRDPRARMIRKRRRAKRTAVGGGVTTGVFGFTSYGTIAADTFAVAQHSFMDGFLNFVGVGFGVAAVAAGAGTFSAVRAYKRLSRQPLPAPAPEVVELPPHGSQAREPMQRLRDAERSLHEALNQLAATGVGEPVVEARSTAAEAASALRAVSARLVAVEDAQRHAPQQQRTELQSDVRRLRADLDEGVDGYGYLVAAAGRAVAASATPERKHLVEDATDRLAGFAEGLRELSGPGTDTPRLSDVDTTVERERPDPA